MTVDVRLAGVGGVLLLTSSALLSQTAVDARLPVVLAALASAGVLAALARATAGTA